MEKWVAFLDESGDYSDPEESVCVAGLLLQDEDHWANQRALRSALDAVDPVVAYPHHTAHLNLPCYYAAAWRLARPSRRRAHPHSSTLERAAALLESSGSVVTPAVRGIQAALKEGKLPRFQLLCQADAWLRARHAGVWSVLSAIRDRAVLRFRAVLENLVECYGPDRCFVIAAADLPHTQEAIERGDRYLRTLTALLERIYAIFRSRPATDIEIWVRPEGRRVDLPELGTSPLLASHVSQCIAEAMKFPLYPPAEGKADPHLHLRADVPTRKSELMHPGIVLADFIANNLHRAIGRNSRWPRLEQRLVERAGVLASTRTRAAPEKGRLPAVAAAGVAQECITRAFALKLDSRLNQQALLASRDDASCIRPRWVADQALSWINVAEVLP